MATTRTPEEVIADWRGSAQVLRARSHPHDAQLIEQCAEEITTAIRPLLTWLNEGEAMLRSGRKVDYFRTRFAEWASQPLPMAELRGRRRWYRALVVPQRVHVSAVKLAGLRGERAS